MSTLDVVLTAVREAQADSVAVAVALLLAFVAVIAVRFVRSGLHDADDVRSPDSRDDLSSGGEVVDTSDDALQSLPIASSASYYTPDQRMADFGEHVDAEWIEHPVIDKGVSLEIYERGVVASFVDDTGDEFEFTEYYSTVGEARAAADKFLVR